MRPLRSPYRRLRRAARDARAAEPYSALLVRYAEIEHAVESYGKAHPHYRGKTWDLWRALRVILDRHSRDEPVLDGGCADSPLLEALQELGYDDLTGCDLVTKGMPHAPGIGLAMADVTTLPFPDRTFGVVASMSVVEHDVDIPAAMGEWARILRPGGDLIVSTDVREPHLSTADVPREITYGMPWNIFDRAGIDRVVDEAARSGLEPIDRLVWQDSELPVTWGGKTYTFAFLAFTKGAG